MAFGSADSSDGGLKMQVNVASIQSDFLQMQRSASSVANITNGGLGAAQATQSQNPENGVTGKSSSADLTKEMSNQIAIRASVEANSAAIRSYDSILGTQVNLKV